MQMSIQTQAKTMTWQRELAASITEPVQLLSSLGLPIDTFSDIARQDFPLRVTHSFLKRMRRGDPNCPLLKQVLPIHAETISPADFSHDPLQEQAFNPKPGVLHKYHGRVLLTVSGGCAINCRYCFRRHFPYADNLPGKENWQASLDYIAADPSISEVILSGGDPLVATDKQLARLATAIAAIPHVTTLRIHTRLPIVLPSRICDSLLSWLAALPLSVIVVVHCNHPAEINAEVAAAIAQLRQQGIVVMNQTVLLKGINDSSEILTTLSRSLWSIGVLPYYIHMLDKVSGAHHFAVSRETALCLERDMRARLSGYLMPRFVVEQPGAASKQPLVDIS